MSKAVITGVAGQDGSHLAELLLSKDYEVYGLIRRASVPRLDNIQHIVDNNKFHLVEGDLTDPSSINKLVQETSPDEYYNLAAQSHVATSFNQPTTTFNINTIGTLNALEAIRNYSPKTKFYQASTSEMFGQNYREVGAEWVQTFTMNQPFIRPGRKIQDESVEFSPRSPYGVSKLAAHQMVKVYRESYGLFGACGILFNHEGPRRGHNFVTRKITRWLGSFCKNSGFINHHEKLKLGNIHAVRDFGYAGDYVRAMWLMLQQDKPDDYVVATGEGHTVEEFLDAAFKIYNLDYKSYIEIDPSLYRPAEVDYLCGCPDKANKVLGWKPEVSFEQLVCMMVRHDTGVS